VGEWFGGIEHGQGRSEEGNCSCCVGQIFQGKRHGCGTRTDTDGSTYEGAWQVGKRHGYGVSTSADARKFRGVFFMNHRHCHCIESRSDCSMMCLWEPGKKERGRARVTRRALMDVATKANICAVTGMGAVSWCGQTVADMYVCMYVYECMYVCPA
jgi:hypothetical protein